MRRSLFHRLTACLVALCFALFSVEAAVADVHDADGSPSALTEQGDGAHLPAVPADDGTQHRNLPGESGHPVHVCHCTHGHAAGSVAARVAVLLAPVHGLAPDIAPTEYAPTRAQEPLVRPPIA